jgi:hypothetical protein
MGGDELRVGDARAKFWIALLVVLCACGVVTRAETMLAWTAPLNSPVSVDGYRLYRDGVLVAEPSAASLSWPIDVSDGRTHTFGVASVHRDVRTNAISESDAATVTYAPSAAQLSDSVPPSVAVSIVQSGNSSNYQATATANDNVGLDRIELSLDTSLFATCYSSPCSAPVAIKSRGSHVVTAVAWDAAGNKAASASTVQR